MNIASRPLNGLRRFACMYAIGGPVGLYHQWKLARIRTRMAKVSEYIARERDLHRDHLRTLNFEFNELVKQQQEASVSAAQFWNWCTRNAGQ